MISVWDAGAEVQRGARAPSTRLRSIRRARPAERAAEGSGARSHLLRPPQVRQLLTLQTFCAILKSGGDLKRHVAHHHALKLELPVVAGFVAGLCGGY